jgi:hypothetical protein
MGEIVTIAMETIFKADLMKSYLESHGVTVFLQAPCMGGRAGTKAYDVQVPAAQAEEAIALLQDIG